MAVLVPTLRQVFHYFNPAFCPKDTKLVRVLRAAAKDAWLSTAATMVFCGTTETAERVATVIAAAIPDARPGVLHGQLAAAARATVVEEFRRMDRSVLV